MLMTNENIQDVNGFWGGNYEITCLDVKISILMPLVIIQQIPEGFTESMKCK